MAEERAVVKTVLFRTWSPLGGAGHHWVVLKHHPAAINGGEQAKGYSIPEHRCSRQKLRGVTPVLVIRHGSGHRAKLKSIAGGPGVLFVIVQQRNWIIVAAYMPNLPDTDARS